MTDSPYYPPRAGFLSPLWHWRERLGRSRVAAQWRVDAGVTLGGFALALFIPGMGIFLRRRHLGRLAMAVCAIAFVTFFVALGYRLGNIAFTVLLTVHSLGLSYYLQPVITASGLGARLVAGLFPFAALLTLIYLPLLHRCETKWFMPITVHGKVAIIHVTKKAPELKRGDWMVYKYSGWRVDEIFADAGVNFAPVIGVAGDEIAFTSTNLFVNGIPRPALSGMPASGGLTVPEKTWFAWADYGIRGHGFSGAKVAQARADAAIVGPVQYIGTPFHWWFWRRQMLP